MTPTATIPDWTRAFVTATVENDERQIVTQHTGWRAVLDPTHMRRYTGCDEWDLTIVADNALHGPGQCGTDCHDEGSAENLCGMSVPDGDQADVIDAARTALAEQGFRVDGPWVPGPGGTLTAPLVPVILDPDCAAFEPDTAARMPAGDPRVADVVRQLAASTYPKVAEHVLGVPASVVDAAIAQGLIRVVRVQQTVARPGGERMLAVAR